MGIRLSPALALLALAGCARPALVSANGALRADTSRVDFGDTWLRTTARRPLVLTNAGRAPLALTFEAAPPFGAPDPAQLGGGQSLTVEPTFSPAALGSAAGSLTVRADDARLSLALTGTGVDPPPCDESSCRTGTLDPATGTCVQTPKPDGTACAEACLTDGVCAQGTCTGAPRACDDGDPCTTDACAPGTGCVHLPLQCAAADPCSAGRCDPLRGCVADQAPDGTACGDADCVTAHVCIAGSCVARAVPDGAACGRATLCQAPGYCQAQVCVQPPPTAVPHLWGYQPAPGRQLIGLVGDEENDLFTVECAQVRLFYQQCEVLSFAPGGAQRWRTPLGHLTYGGGGALRDALMLAGTRLVSTVGPDRVDALDAASGALAWSADLQALGLFPAGSDPMVRIRSAASDGAQLFLVLEGSNGGAVSGTAAVSLELGNGALLHTLALPVPATSLLLDGQGRPYLSHLAGPPTALADAVSALDPALGVRWQRTMPLLGSTVRSMIATHQGQLLLAHQTRSELIATANGALTSAALPPFAWGSFAVWSDAALWGLEQTCLQPPCRGWNEFRYDLDAVDPLTLQVSPALLSPFSWLTPPWLTSRGTALLALATPSPVLRELDAHGQTVMECALEPRSLQLVSGPVLGTGRWAGVVGRPGYTGGEHLEVWGVAGYAPASSRWVSPRGGRRLDLREQ